MLELMRKFNKSAKGYTIQILLAMAIGGFACYWYWTSIYQPSIETKGNEIKTNIETDSW